MQKNKLSKGYALQRSMIDLMNNADYSHPQFWAPFTLVGGIN